MLTQIRERIQGILAVFVLSLLAIPFALWGIGSYFETGPAAAIAEVNGVEISQQAYRQRLDELQRTNAQQAGSDVLKQLVLENLIEQTLLLVDATRSGYRMSDARLARLIQELPYFQTDGRFDPQLYRALLRREGLSPTEFEEQLRSDGLPGQLQQGLSRSAFVTDADVARVVRLLRQERRVSYAVIDPEAFLSGIDIEAQAIEDYYEANRDAFRAPEAVRIAYVTLEASALGGRDEPSEEELRRAYEADAARYVTPARRRVSHILIEVPQDAGDGAAEDARARIEALLQQVRGGADFAALAERHSDDPASAAKGGDLGNVTPGILPEELEAAVLALEPGEVSGPVRTGFGYHLVKLTAYTPEKRRPYEEVKDGLAERLRARRGEEAFYDLSERFRNLVYEHPQELQTAAEALDLAVETSDWFTRAGGDGVTADARVVEAAFEPEVLEGERNSDAIDLDAETLVALRVVDHRPSAVRPLDQVREEIERRLKRQRARERARETAAGWVAQLEQGKALKALARAPGATYHASNTLTRERSGGIEAALAEAVFAAPRPQEQPVVGQVDLGAKGYAVYTLEAVKDVDADAVDTALKKRVRQQLLQRRGADYFRSYREGLRKTADIEINEGQL